MFFLVIKQEKIAFRRIYMHFIVVIYHNLLILKFLHIPKKENECH